jgi:outer membrane protein
MMHRCKSYLFVAACAILGATSIITTPLYAQEAALKIGFVDLQKILRTAAPAKAAEARLNAEVAKREKELAELQANLKAKSERLDRDAAVLPEADRVRRQREIAELDKDFQRRQREYREDMNQKANEETAQVIEKANVVIRQIAAAEKFDLIFQEAVFFSPRIDVTEKVLKALAAAK